MASRYRREVSSQFLHAVAWVVFGMVMTATFIYLDKVYNFVDQQLLIHALIGQLDIPTSHDDIPTLFLC